MGSPDYISYGLALVVLSGGVFGYIKKGAFTRTHLRALIRALLQRSAFSYLVPTYDLVYVLCPLSLSTDSLPSLASGLVFGGLLAYGATRTSKDPNDFLFLLGRPAMWVWTGDKVMGVVSGSGPSHRKLGFSKGEGWHVMLIIECGWCATSATHLSRSMHWQPAIPGL